jgi:FkbM family methyltransferase
MKITYGTKDRVIDITEVCKKKCIRSDNTILIPCNDVTRSIFFTDPLFGVKKKIFIEKDNVISEYEDNLEVLIDMTNNVITTVDTESHKRKLLDIHSKLRIHYGTLYDEVPEQLMATRYLKGHEKVLEIGGNIGRNSLVIASLLEEQSNLVTLESDQNISRQLTENRNLNNMNFHIESSALSKRRLIQKAWETKPSEILEPGHKWVNIITLDELRSKYDIQFDTLVLDCEGAFYYILKDFPEILDNINLIIMENDYKVIEEKQYIDTILKENSFFVDYQESGGWGPCYERFFEVWKKKSS